MADAARELALGKTINLIDGTQVRLVFTMYSLALIEDEFGSVAGIESVFNEGTGGKLIRNVAKLMRFALIDDNDRDVDLATDPDAILRLIPVADLQKVIYAVRDALAEGFQSLQTTTTATEKAETPTTNTGRSPGARSSTSGPSRAVKRAATSGKRRLPK